MLLRTLIQQQEHHHQQQQHHPVNGVLFASNLFAVFISNVNESVPFWCQRASTRPGGLCVWDYHVIALEVPPPPAAPMVWDLDLHHPELPFPCSLQEYAAHALQAHTMKLPPHFERRMRLVPAAALLAHFASDRSHMCRPDGSWAAPPPPYPCIQPPNTTPAAAAQAPGSSGGTAVHMESMNLARYRDMTRDVLQDGRDGVQQPQQPVLTAQQQQPWQQNQGQLQGGGGAAAECSSPGHDAAAAAAAAAVERVDAGNSGGGLYVEEEGPPSNHLQRGAGVGTCVAAAIDVPCSLVTWHDVVSRASSSKYGVVVDEATLLRCLLLG